MIENNLMSLEKHNSVQSCAFTVNYNSLDVDKVNYHVYVYA